MNFDWVTFLCFDGAIRRRIRRPDIQLLRRGLLLRGHEQPKRENGNPLQELHNYCWLGHVARSLDQWQ